MTMQVSADNAVVINEATLTGAPAVRVGGRNVSFTNTELGRISTSATGTAAIELDGEGTTLINEEGGIIAAQYPWHLVIRGSAGADIIDNRSLIRGSVQLGAGADSYINRSGSGEAEVHLGEGDDVYEIWGGSGLFLPVATGGAGYDRFVIRGTARQLYGDQTSGFEQLEVARGGTYQNWNLSNFSGYQTILLEAGGSYNFVTSANPNADIALAGGWFTAGPGSSFRDITGSAGGDSFGMSSATVRNVSLGGGNDTFSWDKWAASHGTGPNITGTVDGGEGTDLLLFAVTGGQTIDLSIFTGFEKVNGGTWTSVTTDVRLINANGYLEFTSDNSGGRMVLAQSHSPLAVVVMSSYGGSAFTLESTATVLQIGSGWTGIESVSVPSAGDPLTVVNNGNVLGDVKLGTGDDSFDGRLGATGGRIYGYAGNDLLRGGGGGEQIYGGYGADTIEGGGGDDLLYGEAGGDRLDGGSGADRMEGGAGNDIYTVDDAGDSVIELAAGGTDEVRTSLSAYTIPANVEILTYTGSGAFAATGDGRDNRFKGGSGADSIDAGGGADILDLSLGGDDDVRGGAGADTFLFGAALTAADLVDGGADKDQLGLQGGYSLVFGEGNLVGIETLALISGSDTRFGDVAGNLYSYALTTVDANVAAGAMLTVNFNGLRAGENVTFDGSAETDGSFFFYGGGGTDILTGGARSDSFFFGAGLFGIGDRVAGGDGPEKDQLGLRGNYSLVFAADTMTGIETIALVSGKDTRFGAAGPDYSYDLTTHDGNVAAGSQLSVNAADLRASETLVFDGSAESDGSFRIVGGRGGDTLTGGAGADILYGGLGADRLKGNGGADSYFYRAAAESTSTGFDRIDGFDFAVDRLELPGTGYSWAGTAEGSLDFATFDSDLAAALAALLTGARQAAWLTATAGDHAGRSFLVVDTNGVAGYQAGEDFVFEMLNTAPPTDLGGSFIV